jgi:hypothetical protein
MECRADHGLPEAAAPAGEGPPGRTAGRDLLHPAASEFFERLLIGRNVLTERREIEALVRYRYRGHSQGALVSALHKAFEAVDLSPLVLGEAAASSPSAKEGDVDAETHG